MGNDRSNVKTFEDLECWKKAVEVRRVVSEIVKRFPGEEKNRLGDQMVRASRSVTANIAEGYGRFHYQENIQFCRQSRGSVYELLDHLLVAEEEGYITKEQLNSIRRQIHECLAVLNGFINYLIKAKAMTKASEPHAAYEEKND